MIRHAIYRFIAAEKTTYPVRLLCRVLVDDGDTYAGQLGKGMPAASAWAAARSSTSRISGNARDSALPGQPLSTATRRSRGGLSRSDLRMRQQWMVTSRVAVASASMGQPRRSATTAQQRQPSVRCAVTAVFTAGSACMIAAVRSAT
jgi:hypothetical protein